PPSTSTFSPLSLHDALPISLHRCAGFGIFPGAVPDVGDGVAGERAQLLGQAIVPLPGAARREEGADGLAATEFWHAAEAHDAILDRKSTRLNSSHVAISYAV